MAQTLAVRGTKLLIKIGDGESPETFAHPCLINLDRSISFSAETVDIPSLDCTDPDAPAWLQREKVSLSGDITGSGRLHIADLGEYDTWLRSDQPRNVEIEIDAASANGGGSWTGAYHLTQFEITGGDKSTTIEVTITLQSTGEVAAFQAAA